MEIKVKMVRRTPSTEELKQWLLGKLEVAVFCSYCNMKLMAQEELLNPLYYHVTCPCEERYLRVIPSSNEEAPLSVLASFKFEFKPEEPKYKMVEVVEGKVRYTKLVES